MDGGLEAAERIALEASQDNAGDGGEAQADAAEENKFQTAIGAWRSRTMWIL